MDTIGFTQENVKLLKNVIVHTFLVIVRALVKALVRIKKPYTLFRENMKLIDPHGLKMFELLNGEIQEADWKRCNIFISSSLTDSTSTETYLIDEKLGAKYIRALNIKNAKRKFQKLMPQ